MSKRKVEIPDNLDLVFSLNCINVETNRIGSYSFSHAPGTHDDLGYALALAVYKAGKEVTVIGSFTENALGGQ